MYVSSLGHSQGHIPAHSRSVPQCHSLTGRAAAAIFAILLSCRHEDYTITTR
jgi:hypothetical protein